MDNIDLNVARKDTLALILAGGKGSRLRQMTESQSKPAVPFGGKFRIIDFPLSNCINSGIRRIGVLTQYKAHTLIKHLQRGWSFLQPELNEFVEIWPAQQQTDAESWYQGTADAVYQNIEIIKGHNPKYVLILAGDHIYKQDYAIMLQEHIERKADVTVACINVPLSAAQGFGVVEVNEQDKIVGFVEKPEHPAPIPNNPDEAFASMGIYIFNAQFLLDLLERDAKNPESSHDFGKDLLPSLLADANMYAHRFEKSCVHKNSDESYWRDVGTLDAYWSANIDLTYVVPDLDLYDSSWPIWTFQEQLPAAKFVFESELRTGMAMRSLVSNGCIISGSLVKGSLLFTRVVVHSFALVEDSVVLPNSEIHRNARVRRAIVTSGCQIPRGMVIGEDADFDSKYFYRTEKGITLVTPDMINKYLEQTNSLQADISHSSGE